MLGSLISAGASILGGILGNSAADKQMEMQKDFAQKGIRWRVNDAKAAGIHPLYALGAPTMSYSPVATGDFGVSQAGQDIGRAIDQTRTSGERQSARGDALLSLQLENQKLQNDALRVEIASRTARLAQQTSPAFPGSPTGIPGQGDFVLAQGEHLRPGRSSGAQDFEDRYGEIGGEAAGAYNLLTDADSNFNRWALDTFGVDPRALTPFRLGAQAAGDARGAFSAPLVPFLSMGDYLAEPSGGGSGW